jgi:hypothetical protein
LWQPVLRAGDPILEVHIPAGGDMSPENCHASMQQVDRTDVYCIASRTRSSFSTTFVRVALTPELCVYTQLYTIHTFFSCHDLLPVGLKRVCPLSASRQYPSPPGPCRPQDPR